MINYQKIKQFKEKFQKRWHFVSKKIIKAHSIKSLEETKQKLSKVPRYQNGKISVLNWSIEYIDAPALASSIEFLMMKKCNDFTSSNPAPVIIDCGANIGISVLNYKRRYPNSKIIAFEPDPNITPILKKNLTNNDAIDVKIIEAAVWIENGKSNFFCQGADGSKLIKEKNNCLSYIEVDTIDLKDYISEPIDLIKMDIEGAEFDVIPNIKNKLHLIKNLIIECHIKINEIEKFSKTLDVLGTAGFNVSISVLSSWTDLLNKPVRSESGFDQYILVSAWKREE